MWPRDWSSDVCTSDREGHLVEEMIASLAAEDPDATVLPYMLSGGTDNKALSRLAIAGYGFAPLQLRSEERRVGNESESSWSLVPKETYTKVMGSAYKE